jgi:hypothetical protein
MQKIKSEVIFPVIFSVIWIINSPYDFNVNENLLVSMLCTSQTQFFSFTSSYRFIFMFRSLLMWLCWQKIVPEGLNISAGVFLFNAYYTY